MTIIALKCQVVYIKNAVEIWKWR